MIYSEKFLSLRTGSKMNREHLAVRIGLSTGAIQDLETCPGHNPHISLILKYMKYFKVKLGDLVKIEDIELGDGV
ncbi:hypothetical protein LCGC14_1989360 [marine sediment metagenome]|uniref:HTH cro/C1-type domain-containing protein n=1 Tax=marine sediment metagenome TaxID=412755 RepID=A0A0F9F6B8_9ZZZZ